jgi:hypothetical protein
MRAIARRLERLETAVLAQDQGILLIVSRAGCESEVATSDIHALQECGYLGRGGINVIRLGENREIKDVPDSARQYLAERRRQLSAQESR